METRPKWLQVFKVLQKECIFDKWEYLYTPLFAHNNSPTPKEFKQDEACTIFTITFNNSQDLFASIAGGNVKAEPAINNADFDDMYTTLTGGVISADELMENVQYNEDLVKEALDKKVSKMQNIVKIHFPEEYKQGEHDWDAALFK